jgi:alkylated DNA nucleotide flippase Atl1
VSGPADVLAKIRAACDGNALPYDVYGAVAEVITELRNAHEIIKLAMNHIPADARSPWFLAIDDAGLCGDGVTRFHERKAALANVGSTS